MALIYFQAYVLIDIKFKVLLFERRIIGDLVMNDQPMKLDVAGMVDRVDEPRLWFTHLVQNSDMVTTGSQQPTSSSIRKSLFFSYAYIR